MLQRLELEFDNTLEELGIDVSSKKGQPLSDDEIEKIRQNRLAGHVVNHFINDMQNICASLNFQLVDESVFNSIHAGRVCWWYTILKPYILIRRIDYRDKQLWKDFETASERLIKKRSQL